MSAAVPATSQPLLIGNGVNLAVSSSETAAIEMTISSNDTLTTKILMPLSILPRIPQHFSE